MPSRYSTKTTITPNERLQLIGLMTIGAEINKQITMLSHAIADILGEKPCDGYAEEYALGGKVEELLERCELTVEAPPADTHRARHEELHRNLDELLADFLTHNPDKLPSETTAIELAAWSNRQTMAPDE